MQESSLLPVTPSKGERVARTQRSLPQLTPIMEAEDTCMGKQWRPKSLHTMWTRARWLTSMREPNMQRRSAYIKRHL
eukprot:7400944-Prorocentrum_lima.AAC.1